MTKIDTGQDPWQDFYLAWWAQFVGLFSRTRHVRNVDTVMLTRIGK